MERLYYNLEAKKETEVREYVKKYVVNMNEKSKIKKLKIKIGDFKFVIYLIKDLENEKDSNKIEIIKTKEKINCGKIKIDDKLEKFYINLCFVIYYDKYNSYQEKAEKLLEKIISDIDYYKKI